MPRIFVKRDQHQRFDTLYYDFKTTFPDAEVIWDRRRHETVSRLWHERRKAPPESWQEVGFLVEEPTTKRDRPWDRAAFAVDAALDNGFQLNRLTASLVPHRRPRATRNGDARSRI